MTTVVAVATANPLEHVVQHRLWPTEGPITVLSDHVVMQILAAVLLLLLLPAAVRRFRGEQEADRLTPRGLGNFFEAICQFLREQVARPALHEHTDRFVRYIWTVFFFILVCNLLGLLPLAPLTQWLFGLEHGIGGTATGNIYVTGTLAASSLVMIVVNGFRLAGLRYLAHFCPGPLWLAPLL
nr:F0F1 ATP synthase subunit A [Planctomycetales bacterium]NIP70101.1 F0F1 ATP synthase subunit A [Planctomycetales bacterium]